MRIQCLRISVWEKEEKEKKRPSDRYTDSQRDEQRSNII